MVEHFKVRQHNLMLKVKKMNRYGLVDIVVDGKRFLIKIADEKIISVEEDCK